MIEDVGEFVTKNRKQILDFYYQYSVLDELTTVIRQETLLNQKSFGRRFRLPRDILLTNVEMSWSSLVRGLHVSESQHIINELNNLSSKEEIINTKPEISWINQKVIELMNTGNFPNYIIIPVAFFTHIMEKGFTERIMHPFIEFESGKQYLNSVGNRLRIFWSSKYIKLNEIIIGSSIDSYWKYKPDLGTGERVTVDFDVKDFDKYLVINEVFEYIRPSKEQIQIMHFSEEVCKMPNS